MVFTILPDKVSLWVIFPIDTNERASGMIFAVKSEEFSRHKFLPLGSDKTVFQLHPLVDPQLMHL